MRWGAAVDIAGGQVQLGIPEQMQAHGPALIPLGRDPSGDRGGVFLLCIPWATFITGQVLGITGGQLSGMTS